MKILIDNLILITVDKENHATSYHRTVKVQRHTFLSSLELWAKEESIGDPIMSYNVIFSRGVGIFDLIFLSSFFTKVGSFCVHWKGNFLNFSKLSLLLSLARF